MRDLLRVLQHTRRYANWMALGIFAALVTLVANIGLLATAGWFIAAMAVAGASGTAINYFTPAALIRAFAIARSAGRYLERLVTHEATFRLLAGLRVWFFEHLEPLAPARLQQTRSGDLLSRIRADIDCLDNLYLRLLLPILVAVLGAGAAVAFLALYSGALAVLALAGLLLAGLVLPALVQRLGAPPSARQVETAAALRTAAVDGLQGMAELTVYGQAQRQSRAIAALSTAWVADQRRLASLNGLSLAGAGLLANLTLWGGLIILVPLVGLGRIDGPELTMLAFVLLACFEAVAPLPPAFRSLGAILAATRRLLALIDTEPAVPEPSAPAALPPRLDLVFDTVSLRYQPDAPWALQDVSFAVRAGERVALIGPSGSGKSSVINLLLRFWDYQGGCITLGGVDIRTVSGQDIRRQVAVVSQHGHLFNTSIRENLLLARPGATPEQLEQACAAAQIQELIASLPQGYDTPVGEAGLRLSGGQARRLLIARAVLRDAPILVLDEPTEGLDSATARSLMTAIQTLMAGRTVLLVSHRAADLAGMDRIILLDQGRVLDQGVHAELLTRCPAYRGLFDRLGEELGEIPSMAKA